MDTASVRLSIPDEVDPVSIMGGGDAVLRAIEERTGARIVVRGRQISLSGSAEEVELLTRLFTFLIKEAARGHSFRGRGRARHAHASRKRHGPLWIP